jgi:hypothetical protein
MTIEEKEWIRRELQQKSKEYIIELFIKMREMVDKSNERLYRVENELNGKTSLEELIDKIN